MAHGLYPFLLLFLAFHKNWYATLDDHSLYALLILASFLIVCEVEKKVDEGLPRRYETRDDGFAWSS